MPTSGGRDHAVPQAHDRRGQVEQLLTLAGDDLLTTLDEAPESLQGGFVDDPGDPPRGGVAPLGEVGVAYRLRAAGLEESLPKRQDEGEDLAGVGTSARPAGGHIGEDEVHRFEIHLARRRRLRLEGTVQRAQHVAAVPPEILPGERQGSGGTQRHPRSEDVIGMAIEQARDLESHSGIGQVVIRQPWCGNDVSVSGLLHAGALLGWTGYSSHPTAWNGTRGHSGSRGRAGIFATTRL